jgi:acyl-CoA thioester hydrolase
MRHEIRIIFGDTDQMGVVYYANYLRFFESARAAYWRSLGKSYKDLEEAQVAMPVIEAHCNYKRPSYYEDLLEVDIRVGELRQASLRFDYTIYRGTDVIAEGYTRHAVIGPNGKPRPLPQSMRDLVAARPS